jgi:hypothetical protein
MPAVKQTTVLLLLGILLSACAMSPPLGRADLLGFIQDGQTTREDTYLHLGEPSGLYEDGRIMSFRLGEDNGGYFPIGKASGFSGVRFSLIMVFSEAGILARHALVQVKAP